MVIRKRKMRKRGLGWIPDIPDPRDRKFKLLKFVQAPKKVDLRDKMPPIEDQGSLGSCTANALVSALEYLEIKHGEPFVDYSRLFLYYNERVYLGTEQEDSGAIIRDGIKSLNRRGICPESMVPYRISDFANKPSADAYREARNHKTISYQRLNTLAHMKSCLAEGHPFTFGFAVFSSFFDSDSDGEIPMPDWNNEEFLGGHAVLAVGYDNDTQRFLCRNSWGKNWGLGGYFTMPYQYLVDRNLSDDFWVIRF